MMYILGWISDQMGKQTSSGTAGKIRMRSVDQRAGCYYGSRVQVFFPGKTFTEVFRDDGAPCLKLTLSCFKRPEITGE